MTLPTSVYTANRGYAWSNVPEGLSVAKLNSICRSISALRGDFPDPLRVEVGLVTNAETAAVFTLQNVDKWDSEGRASDYFAFAFFPLANAREIDFLNLINNDFFWTPSKTPPAKIVYDGPCSADYPKGIPVLLRTRQSVLIDNPRSVGAILADVGNLSDNWLCHLYQNNTLEITRN